MSIGVLLDAIRDYKPTEEDIERSRKRFRELVEKQNEEARKQRIAVNSPEFLNRTYIT